MIIDESSLDGGHGSPELRLLRSRRVTRLFRFAWLSAAVAITTLFAYVFARFSGSHEPIVENMTGVLPIYSAISFIFLLGSVVLLQLEIGSDTMRWGATYREARATIDADQARRVEQSADREQRSEKLVNSARDFNAGLKGVTELADLTLTELRKQAELRETEKWESTNYASITRSIVERLQAEIATQGSRANINLVIALIVAAVGVVILAWLSLNVSELLLHPPTASQNQMMLYAGAFAAKLALALSANVFAFFFLATYRRTLSEIRYFHNELTNVQTRVLALYFAADRGMDASLALVINGLSATERNFILKKGESTTDLSLKGLDASEVNSLAALISEAIKMAKSP